MKKTIKELADEIGVSKTAINKKIDNEFKRKHFSKEGNKFLVDEEGQKLIKASFSETVEAKKQLEMQTLVSAQTQTQPSTELVDVLKDRLTSMDKQLETKDEQIKQLQKLLDQQQVLTLQANKKIEQLELKFEAEPTASAEPVATFETDTAATDEPTQEVVEETVEVADVEGTNERDEAETEAEALVQEEQVENVEELAEVAEDLTETETVQEIAPKKSLWKRLFK